MSDQREILAQWSQSQGNLRRFLEERVMPPLDDDAQRTAGRAAAAAAVEETFGIDIDDFALGVDSVGGAFETAGRHKITPPDPEVPQDTEAAAFFDVDNTLIQGSSLILLAQGLFRKRFISLSELAPALWKQFRYRVSGSENTGDIAEGREQALAVVKGKSVAELKAACREIVDSRMLQKSYADTIELASMHLAAGQQVWLVSATPVQIGQALAETLGFTGALGTVAEEDDGKFTGRLVGDILHGPGKKHAVAALAALQQLDLSPVHGVFRQHQRPPHAGDGGLPGGDQPRPGVAQARQSAGLGDTRLPLRAPGRSLVYPAGRCRGRAVVVAQTPVRGHTAQDACSRVLIPRDHCRIRGC